LTRFASQGYVVHVWRAAVEQLDMEIFEPRDPSLNPDVDERAVLETVYLLSVPGMCDSVKDGLAQSPTELATLLDW